MKQRSHLQPTQSRTIGILLGLLLLLSACLPAQKSAEKTKIDRSTPEALGRTLIQVLAHKDTAAVRQLCPTLADLAHLTDESGSIQAEREHTAAEAQKLYAKIQAAVHYSYNLCANHRIDYENPYLTAEIQEIKLEELGGLDTEYANVNLRFRSHDTDLELRLKEVMKTSRGWFLGPKGFEIHQFAKK